MIWIIYFNMIRIGTMQSFVKMRASQNWIWNFTSWE